MHPPNGAVQSEASIGSCQFEVFHCIAIHDSRELVVLLVDQPARVHFPVTACVDSSVRGVRFHKFTRHKDLQSSIWCSTSLEGALIQRKYDVICPRCSSAHQDDLLILQFPLGVLNILCMRYHRLEQFRTHFWPVLLAAGGPNDGHVDQLSRCKCVSDCSCSTNANLWNNGGWIGGWAGGN
jgi:hypothetical protein